MRCPVDTSFPDATKYDQAYLWEPSPRGDISIGPGEMLATGDLDLETILAEMKALAAKGGMIVVTHPNQDGLRMELIGAGGVSAGFGEMDKNIIPGKSSLFPLEMEYEGFVVMATP